jgi:hypothetical protein
LEFNGTHQLLVYTKGFHLLGNSTDTTKDNSETLLSSRNTGLEINVEMVKYMIVPPHPNLGENQNKRMPNESFENVEKFK